MIAENIAGPRPVGSGAGAFLPAFPFFPLVLLALFLAGCATVAPDPLVTAVERPVGRAQVVYKTVDGIDLTIHIFLPERRAGAGVVPAIIFFHGGGWTGGEPGYFFPHCRYFAHRGMAAFSAEYRIQSKHGTSPLEAMADANSAMRWLRAHADRLGIDPGRIVAAGGSAGGHLAAATAMLEGFDEPGDDLSISTKPQALVLFNPAVYVDYIDGPEAFRGRSKEASPILHIRGGLPPTLVLHGTEDDIVPYPLSTLFCTLMNEAGNDCRLITFPGKGHGFFNYRPGNIPSFRRAILETDRFLTDLGYLKGEPLFAPGPATRD